LSVDSLGEMPILEHLEELRWRIIKVIAAMCIAAVACYFFTDTLFRWIRWPLDMATPPNQKINLNYLRLGDSFSIRIKLAMIAAIFITIPISLYQFWRFVTPGLYQHDKKAILPLVFWSSLLFLIGAAMCFFWVMPITIKFLIGIAPENVTPVLTANEYISFIMWTTVSFGIVFQLPLIALFLGKLGIINWRMLSKGRRYAIVIIAFVAAVVTPSTDALSMILLATPLYMLYEVSIWILRFQARKRRKADLAG
jgi:sec-independent protein translocase protein TatC